MFVIHLYKHILQWEFARHYNKRGGDKNKRNIYFGAKIKDALI